MKKALLCLLLVLSMIPVAVFADVETAEEAQNPVEEALTETPEEEIIEWDYDELTVGTVTPLTGDFFTSLWGNTTVDIDVRLLIHGYNLIEWDTALGGFQVDPTVVTGLLAMEEEATGNHIFNIVLNSDLIWSDGTKITAWDYAFSWMLTAWPGIQELGGTPAEHDYILGMKDWRQGAASAITGIHVVADDQMTVTISHEYLPYFFEMGLLDCTPVPMSVIAPDCRLADDGNGVYFARGGLNASQLRGTLMGDGGYITKPSVSCGPYMLTSYDGNEAHFEINPNFLGDSKGVKPTIQRIILRNVNNETMVSMLAAGEIGLINKCVNAETAMEGQDLVSNSTQFAMSNYARSGFGFISYNCERPAVASETVRRAIAMCLDKDATVSAATGNFGIRVDGYYGLGQWMVSLLNRTLPFPVEEPAEGATPEEIAAYEEELAAWEELTMDEIPLVEFSPEKAAELLEEDGWKAGANGIRAKNVNGQSVPLTLKLLVPEGSAIGEVLNETFVPNLAAAGISLEIAAEPFEKLTEKYYKQVQRDCDMIFIATNFDVVFDPAVQFLPGGERNWSNSGDKQLYDLAVDMRQTEPGDTYTYCVKWIEFQKRFAEEMPMLPIYSNVYFDFYPRVLQNYNVSQHVGWSRAIVSAIMADVPEEEPEDLEGLEEF